MARSGSRLPRRVPELSTLNSQAGETGKIFRLKDLSRKTLTSCMGRYLLLGNCSCVALLQAIHGLMQYLH